MPRLGAAITVGACRYSTRSDERPTQAVARDTTEALANEEHITKALTFARFGIIVVFNGGCVDAHTIVRTTYGVHTFVGKLYHADVTLHHDSVTRNAYRVQKAPQGWQVGLPMSDLPHSKSFTTTKIQRS